MVAVFSMTNAAFLDRRFMDPITLATLTSAVTVLGTEILKGAASSVGKDLWGKIKAVFGWNVEPSMSDLPVEVATRLSADGALAKSILALLKSSSSIENTATALVGNINADQVIVSQTIHVEHDFNVSVGHTHQTPS